MSRPTFLLFSIGDGGWAFDGIEMTSITENDDGQMVVNCMSTHLTSFAVLVDVSGSLSVSSNIHVLHIELMHCRINNYVQTSQINSTLIFAYRFRVNVGSSTLFYSCYYCPVQLPHA